MKTKFFIGIKMFEIHFLDMGFNKAKANAKWPKGNLEVHSFKTYMRENNHRKNNSSRKRKKNRSQKSKNARGNLVS